jgi:hypothetical protein
VSLVKVMKGTMRKRWVILDCADGLVGYTGAGWLRRNEREGRRGQGKRGEERKGKEERESKWKGGREEAGGIYMEKSAVITLISVQE